jgi:hypothetical protein
MNIFVHLKIADQVHRRILKDYGIRLNRTGFLIGNILPDIQHSRIKADHFFKDSWRPVTLLATRIGRSQIESDHGNLTGISSVDIGMICHFVSDYFCYAHHEQFGPSMVKHILYETKMTFVFDRKLFALVDSVHHRLTPQSDWMEDLQLAVLEHARQSPSMRLDICQAIQNGIKISSQLAMTTGGVYAADEYTQASLAGNPG